MTTLEIDTPKTEAFGASLLELISHAFLGPAISVGHRTGLFDAMALLPWATSGQIATVAGLDELDVRDWLEAMALTGIVESNRDGATYLLAHEHTVFTASGTASNTVASMVGAEDGVVSCTLAARGLPCVSATSRTPAGIESTALLDSAHIEAQGQNVDYIATRDA